MLTVTPQWNVPYLFKGAKIIQDRCPWTDAERLTDLLKDKLLSFRIGKQQQSLFVDRVQFEKDCLHIQSTMKDFLLWTNATDETALPEDHPLKNYSPKEYFAYADYMHLPELLDENKEDPLIHMIDWSEMGLKDRDGNQSTLWIGSQGSHTPCHYDTYGINFVAQIVGRKRWLLFPPDSPLGPLQTRIPYEESSVYIDVEPTWMQKFQNIDVFDIVLQPGDVLFVPKHWWHFVSSMDTVTVSVNSWLEQSEDQVERIKEMLVRQIITSTMFAHDCSTNEWLNHNEVVTDPSTNLTILSSLLNQPDSTDTSEPSAKRPCSDTHLIVPADHVREQRLTSTSLGHLQANPQTNSASSNPSDSDILLKRLLKAMTARETIDLIYQKLISLP